jgi:O-antigen ligase
VPKWTVGQRAALLVVACAGIASMPFLIPETSWKRLGTIGEEISHGTLNQRTSVWKAGFDVFREQPLGGVGINAYAPAVQRVLGTPVQPKSKNGPPDVVMLVAHNSFISILVEQGIVGLGIFLALLLSLFLRAFRFSGTLRSLYVISLITWSVGVMDLTWEFRKPSWLLFGLIAATPLARRITQVRGIATQYGSKHGLTRHPVNA